MVLYVKGYFLNTQKKQGKQGRGYTVVIKRLCRVRVRDYRLGPTEAERREQLYIPTCFLSFFVPFPIDKPTQTRYNFKSDC